MVISCESPHNSPENISEEVISRKVNTSYSLEAMGRSQPENDTILKRFQQLYEKTAVHEYAKFWVDEEISRPYISLYRILNEYPAYTPNILTIQKKEANKYLLKFAMMAVYEEVPSLDIIYNILVIRAENGQYYFKSLFSENLAQLNVKRFENITYYFDDEDDFSIGQAKQQVQFENKLVDFLEVRKLYYNYVIFNSAFELYTFLGYDYHQLMFLSDTKGGLSMPSKYFVFSGNNKACYPHETVHLYVGEYFPKYHNLIGEGLATFLGGSKGISYPAHLANLKQFITEEHIDICDYLMQFEKRQTVITAKTSFKYSFGAFLCDLVYQKKGKEGLFKLLNSGWNDEELYQTLAQLLNININEIDRYVKNELSSFVPSLMFSE